MASRLSSTGSALSGRRRALLGVVVSLGGHALIVGATTLLLASPVGRSPLASAAIEVALVEAPVEAARILPPANQPASQLAAVSPRTPLANPHAQPRLKARLRPPAASALAPGSASLDMSETVLPVSAAPVPHQAVAPAPPAAPTGPNRITQVGFRGSRATLPQQSRARIPRRRKTQT